jgi:hypothetical protein
LLNSAPNVVALFEPLRPDELTSSSSDVQKRLAEVFTKERHSIITTGEATSKSASNHVPCNSLGQKTGHIQARPHLVDGFRIRIAKALTSDFVLIIKEPAIFTALSGLIKDHFPLFAVVRNPLAVLLSWCSTDFPVSRGRLPYAEAFDHSLAACLDAERDVLNRQLHILNWFFVNYEKHLLDENVVRYESMIASGGKALNLIVPGAVAIGRPLQSQNTNTSYDRCLVGKITERLLSTKGSLWRYYTRSDIIKLSSDFGCP